MESKLIEKVCTPKTQARNLHIREVANGYVLRLEVTDPKKETAEGRHMEQELVVTNLPALLKTTKTFFEPILIEEGDEEDE